MLSDKNPLKAQFAEAFAGHGWQLQFLDNDDLKLRKNDAKVQLGDIEFEAGARWTHYGEKGHICFPMGWLRFEAVRFYGVEFHGVEPELQYVLKEHPEILNSEWVLRDKDRLDKECLRGILERK